MRLAGWGIAALLYFFLSWMALTGTAASQELLLGAACALFCATASLLTWKAMRISIAVDAGDILAIWTVPWNVIRDTWTIVAVLLKELLGIAPADSHFRAIPFEHRKGRRARLRRVLATFYTSISPNSIVIGIDEEQHLALFHELTAAAIPKAMKRLGAKP